MKCTKSVFAILILLVNISFFTNALAGWDVYDVTDPMTDVRKAYVRLNSTNKVRGSYSSNTVALTARCYSDNSVDVVVDWGQFLNLRDSNALQVRVGDEKFQNLRTLANTEGDAQFVKNTGVMIKNLMKEESIKLRTTDYQGTATGVAEFDTAGFKAAWAQACDWHFKYDSKVGYVYRKKLTGIQGRVFRNWRRPKGLSGKIRCNLLVALAPLGEIDHVEVRSCTPNNPALITSIGNAVWDSNPLPVAPSADEILQRGGLLDLDLYFD